MLAAVPVVGVASIAGVGWTCVLRQDGLLGAGPKVSDALPLLQLAGADAQPLTRVAVAWLLAGLMSGLAMYRWRRIRRALFAGVLGTLLLAMGSDASFALARNLKLSHVLSSRAPGLGMWLEAVLFAAGATIPSTLARRPSGLGAAVGNIALATHEHRNASDDDRDRNRMSEDGCGSGSERFAEVGYPTRERDQR